METNDAVTALSALAQETRLLIFRWLVERGPRGAPAGEIADEMGLPGATLSFHLSQLKQAGLLSCVREGRSLIYSANYPAMTDLMAYLTENCCRGDESACGPIPSDTAIVAADATQGD